MAKVIPHSAGVRAEDGDPTTTDAPVLDTDRDLQAARELGEARRVLISEIGKRIVGQADVVEHLLIALFARGPLPVRGRARAGQDAARSRPWRTCSTCRSAASSSRPT